MPSFSELATQPLAPTPAVPLPAALGTVAPQGLEMINGAIPPKKGKGMPPAGGTPINNTGVRG